MINKTNNQETVSRLKKAYSTLAQATNIIINENGLPKLWANSNDNVYKLYKKHLFMAKDCGAVSGCLNQGAYKKLDGNINDYWDTDANRKIVLSDGVQVMFAAMNTDCGNNWGGSTNFCGNIYVDLNGEKIPNQIGRDVFAFILKPNGLYPMGCDSDSCINTWGGGCTCKVLREGAINY